MATTWVATAGLDVSGGTLTGNAGCSGDHALTADSVNAGNQTLTFQFSTDSYYPTIVLTTSATLPAPGTTINGIYTAWTASAPAHLYIFNLDLSEVRHYAGTTPTLTDYLDPPPDIGSDVQILLNFTAATVTVTVDGVAAWTGGLTGGSYYAGATIFDPDNAITANLAGWGAASSAIQLGNGAGHAVAHGAGGAVSVAIQLGNGAGHAVAHGIAGGRDTGIVGGGTSWGPKSAGMALAANTATVSGANGAESVRLNDAIAVGLHRIAFTYGPDAFALPDIVLSPNPDIPSSGGDFTDLDTAWVWSSATLYKITAGQILSVHDAVSQPPMPGDVIEFVVNMDVHTAQYSKNGETIWSGLIPNWSQVYLGFTLYSAGNFITVDMAGFGPPDVESGGPGLLESAATQPGRVRYLAELADDPAKPAPLPSILLPLSSFQARARSGAASYASAVVPNGVAYADAIADRQAGVLLIHHVYTNWDGSDTWTEIVRVNLQDIRHDEGVSSHSITLTGYKQVTNSSPKSVPFSGLSYRSVGPSGIRIRGTVQADIKAGDTVSVGGATFLVSEIAYTVSVRSAEMEIAA